MNNEGAPDTYPVLSQQPLERPQQDTTAQVMANYNTLMAEQDQLTGAIQADKARATDERAEKVEMVVDGKVVLMTVEQAIARMEADRLADIEAARRQTSTPVAKLGGRPPKDQR